MRAALAALVAAALLVAGASAQGFCEGEGWEALAPEVRPSCSLAGALDSSLRERSAAACRRGTCRLRFPPPLPPPPQIPSPRAAAPTPRSHPCPLPPQDVAPEVLNVTVTEFNKQFVPSEENPDDGQRPVWVPCDAGILESEVEAACLRVRRC